MKRTGKELYVKEEGESELHVSVFRETMKVDEEQIVTDVMETQERNTEADMMRRRKVKFCCPGTRIRCRIYPRGLCGSFLLNRRTGLLFIS